MRGEPKSYDLIVIGSGAAGLAAAITAGRQGRSVLVLERTDLLGGTTACSGALLWVPFNKWQKAAGEYDSRKKTEAYIEECLAERANDARWRVFLDRVNPFVDTYLEGECGLKFGLVRYPDSYGERPNGSCTRHIVARPFPLGRLGAMSRRIRSPVIAPMSLLSLTNIEKTSWIKPQASGAMLSNLPTLIGNLILNRRAMGQGLIAAMTWACERYGVDFMLETTVTDIETECGRAALLRVENPDGSELRLRAHGGIIIATGGMSWNAEANAAYFDGQYQYQQDPPTNLGDHLRFAKQTRAALDGLDEAWFLPTVFAGDEYMGRRVGRALVGDRMLPHQIWVNKRGRRFVNEAGQNAAEALRVKSAAGEYENLPCFSIFDKQYKDKYPIAVKPAESGKPDLGYVRADTIDGLAQQLGIDDRNLEKEVRAFNAMARAGRDIAYGRGAGAYEQYFVGSEGNLGTIEKPPFFGYRVYLGGVGTKGGIKTDKNSQALDVKGEPLPGLYAAGNAAHAFNGPITVAAGCTISPAMIMGHVGAEHALGLKSFA